MGSPSSWVGVWWCGAASCSRWGSASANKPVQTRNHRGAALLEKEVPSHPAFHLLQGGQVLIRASKMQAGAQIQNCPCKNGQVREVKGTRRSNNLVVYCECGRRYVATLNGLLVESAGSSEVVVPKGVTPPEPAP